jgi:hypothetical protein
MKGQSSLALDELSWIDAAAHLARDPRLIIPVGALEQHGPHLPLGSNVLIARRVAVDLSTSTACCARPPCTMASTCRANESTPERRRSARRRCTAPSTSCSPPGRNTASASSSSSRRTATSRTSTHSPRSSRAAARPRRLDLGRRHRRPARDAARPPPRLRGRDLRHAVPLPRTRAMDRARDFELAPGQFDRYIRGQLPAPPPGGAGVVGNPTRATAQKGQAIYRAPAPTPSAGPSSRHRTTNPTQCDDRPDPGNGTGVFVTPTHRRCHMRIGTWFMAGLVAAAAWHCRHPPRQSSSTRARSASWSAAVRSASRRSRSGRTARAPTPSSSRRAASC